MTDVDKRTLGRYIFLGLIIGAIFGMGLGAANGSGIFGLALGALAGTYLGWFMGMAALENRDQE